MSFPKNLLVFALCVAAAWIAVATLTDNFHTAPWNSFEVLRTPSGGTVWKMTIDGCEYLGVADSIIHKGNCTNHSR